MWNVVAVCDGCGGSSAIFYTRSSAAAMLKRVGWIKGRTAGAIYCPECAPYYVEKLDREREERWKDEWRKAIRQKERNNGKLRAL